MKTNTLNTIIAASAAALSAVVGLSQAAVNVGAVAITVSFIAIAGVIALAISDYRGNRRDYSAR